MVPPSSYTSKKVYFFVNKKSPGIRAKKTVPGSKFRLEYKEISYNSQIMLDDKGLKCYFIKLEAELQKSTLFCNSVFLHHILSFIHIRLISKC